MKKEIFVTRSSLPPLDEYINEIKELWESRLLTNMGIKHQALQKKLEGFLETKNVVLFSNGHMALEGIIEAMAFPSGSEIITTPFTFASTTHSIVRKGLVPVFCDINKDDYTIDVSKIEGLITNKTVAIMPVHVYGNICDVLGIKKIADKYNLKVIYDSAHAFAERVNGVSVGCFGDASMFSFHATKVFNTIEGGAVCTNDDEIAKRLNFIKNFGISGEERCEYFGGNSKMNEFQAAMGLCNLRHIEEEIKKRKKATDLYNTLLGNKEGIKIRIDQPNICSNYSYYPVVFDGYKFSRNEVYERLKQEGIIARKYFYPLTNELECYKNSLFFGSRNTPIAKRISDNVLTLPLYSDLTQEEIESICGMIL